MIYSPPYTPARTIVAAAAWQTPFNLNPGSVLELLPFMACMIRWLRWEALRRIQSVQLVRYAWEIESAIYQHRIRAATPRRSVCHQRSDCEYTHAYLLLNRQAALPIPSSRRQLQRPAKLSKILKSALENLRGNALAASGFTSVSCW